MRACCREVRETVNERWRQRILAPVIPEGPSRDPAEIGIGESSTQLLRMSTSFVSGSRIAPTTKVRRETAIGYQSPA